MNENWLEIVASLKPYFDSNSLEGEYQREIENCLKILGWKMTNGTLESQPTIPIGNNNFMRPDIVLCKRDDKGELRKVLPIEIKRPSNNNTQRQNEQLRSYMRQLRLDVGIFIGEDIQIQYDDPNDDEPPTCIISANFSAADANGDKICELLSYKDFNLLNLVDFCKKRYDEMRLRHKLHINIRNRIVEGNGEYYIKQLLEDKFVQEGYTHSIIQDELKAINIKVSRCVEAIGANVLDSSTTHRSLTKHENNVSKKKHHYGFNGKSYNTLADFVVAIIHQYVSDNPNITFDELSKTFPPEICGKNSKLRTVILNDEYLEKKDIDKEKDIVNRYYPQENRLIELKDGSKVRIGSQWGEGKKYFSNFLEVAKKLYNITIE